MNYLRKMVIAGLIKQLQISEKVDRGICMFRESSVLVDLNST